MVTVKFDVKDENVIGGYFTVSIEADSAYEAVRQAQARYGDYLSFYI